MKNLKKMLAALLVVAMIASIAVVPAFAETFSYESQATALNKLGLYKGISETEFVPDLGTALDRQTGVVMLLRMFGQEEEALLLSDEQAAEKLAKFKDAGTIEGWAKKQVAYAVDKGFVKGYPEDATFRPAAGLNGKAYCSLLLQQLGYDGDFDYHSAALKLSEIGGLTDAEATLFNSDAQIKKDTLVGISYGALQAKYKADGVKLVKALLNSGNITVEQLKDAGVKYLDIVSVAAIPDVNVDIGGTPELPATVKVTYDDESTGDVSVTWPTVNTATEGEQTIEGVIADTAIKATVKVIVAPAVLKVEAASAGNLKEIILTFNKPVDEDKAKDKGNYKVKNGISNVELSADKKTVTLLLTNPIRQQADVTVTVDEELGFDDDVDVTVKNIKDTTAPIVAEVVAVGNGLVKVTFNEPVNYATALANYTIDGKLFGSKQPELSANGKTVSFNLTTRLSAGTHKIAVKNKVEDFAGFKIESNETEFAVVEDTTAPTGTVESATQTKVVIKFSEEVVKPDIDDVDTNTSAEIASIELAEDNVTFTINFKVTNALPTAGGKITIKNLTDYSGNKVDFSVNVTPTYDVTRPEFVSYTVEDNQTKIVLEFNEEVLDTQGEFELKDKDGNEVDFDFIGYYVKDSKTIKTKLVLKNDNGFAAEKHTLKISEVADNNPLKNEIVDVTITIDIEDQKKPEVESVVIKGGSSDNAIYVRFTEDVDVDSATEYSNYSYVLNTNSVNVKLNKNIADIDLLSDGKTVCITFETGKDDSVDVDDIVTLQISSVKDLAGNEMDTKAIDDEDAQWSDYVNLTAPAIAGAKVTDKNKIEIDVEGSINDKTLNPDDFVITAGEYSITAWDAEYKDGKIILTVNADIASDATYEGEEIELDLDDPDDIDTVDAFENKLVIKGGPSGFDGIVDDGYAPKATSVASAVYDNEGTIITIELSENLNVGSVLDSTDVAQFVVKADGTRVTPVIRYADAVVGSNAKPAKLVIVINGDYRGKKVQVSFYADATPTILDGSNNALGDFSFTETVKK